MLQAFMRLSMLAGVPKSRFVKLFSTEPVSEARKFIEQFVKENKVALFIKGTPSAPMCGFSRAVCQILDFHGVRDLAAVNVLEDEVIRTEIKKFSSWPTIPQVFVSGELVGGCDIMMEMHKNGELEKLLVQEGVVTTDELDDVTKLDVPIKGDSPK